MAGEFRLEDAFVEARVNAGLTQEELASRMGTTKAVITRLENGRLLPSGRILRRIAEATGTRVRVHFDRTSDGSDDR